MSGIAFQRAWLLFRQSRFDMARESLGEILATDPEHAKAHALLSVCYAHQKQFDPANHHAHEALRIDPGDAHHHYSLAYVFATQKNFRGALAAINEALSHDPGSQDYHALCAGIHYELGEFAAAMHNADAALAIDPQHQDALFCRGASLRKLNRLEEADAVSRQALSLAPESADAHILRGLVENDAAPGQAAGREHFEEALRINPTHHYAPLGLLHTYRQRYRLIRFAEFLVRRPERHPRKCLFLAASVVAVPCGLFASNVITSLGLDWLAFYALSCLLLFGAPRIADIFLLDHPDARPALCAQSTMKFGTLRHRLAKALVLHSSVCWFLAAASLVDPVLADFTAVCAAAGAILLYAAICSHWLLRKTAFVIMAALLVTSLTIGVAHLRITSPPLQIRLQPLNALSFILLGAFVLCGLPFAKFILKIRYVGPGVRQRAYPHLPADAPPR